MFTTQQYTLLLQILEKFMLAGVSFIAAITAARYSRYDYKLWFDASYLEKLPRIKWIRRIPVFITVLILLLYALSSFYVTIATAIVRESTYVTSQLTESTRLQLLTQAVSPITYYTISGNIDKDNIFTNDLKPQSNQT